MNNPTFQNELFQLPDQIYHARINAIQAEQQFLAADRAYDDLRTQHYLAQCANGEPHSRAQQTAAVDPAVLQARSVRDQHEAAHTPACEIAAGFSWPIVRESPNRWIMFLER